MFRKIIGALVVVAIAVVVWAVVDRDDSKSTDKKAAKVVQPVEQLTAKMTAEEVMAIDPQFEPFTDVLEKSGVDEEISKDGPYTLFVPSPAAFGVLGADALAELNKDPEGELADMVRRHVVKGRVTLAKLYELDGKTVSALDGTKLEVKIADGAVSVGGVKLAKTDIKAKDATIHVLDSVIPPPA